MDNHNSKTAVSGIPEQVQNSKILKMLNHRNMSKDSKWVTTLRFAMNSKDSKCHELSLTIAVAHDPDDQKMRIARTANMAMFTKIARTASVYTYSIFEKLQRCISRETNKKRELIRKCPAAVLFFF